MLHVPGPASLEPNSARVILDDELFANFGLVEVLAHRRGLDRTRETRSICIEPRSNRTFVRARDRCSNELELLRVSVSVTRSPLRTMKLGMSRRLPLIWTCPCRTSCLASERELRSQAMHHVVETALEERKHLFARSSLATAGFLEIAMELAFQDAIDATHFLFLAKPNRVLAELDASLTVLTGRVRTTRMGTLLRVAALPLEVELHALATAQLTNRSNVPSHLRTLEASNPAPLGRPATVVGNRSHVADEGDLETRRLKSTQRALATGARALHEHCDGAHAVLLRAYELLLRQRAERQTASTCAIP
jgi:hypothetical protein